MSIVDWEQLAEHFEEASGKSRYWLTSRLTRILEEDAERVGAALWEGHRRGAITAMELGLWYEMARAPLSEWSDEDLLSLLETCKDYEELTSTEGYRVDLIPGWHYQVEDMLARREGDLGALVKAWRKFDEPLRTSLGTALVRHGAMGVEALDPDALGVMAARVARFGRASHFEEGGRLKGLDGIWPAEVWGRAVLDAALDPELAEVKFDMIRVWFEQATIEEQARLACKCDSGDAPRAASLLASHGAEARAVIEELIGELLAEADEDGGATRSRERSAVLVLALGALLDEGEVLPGRCDRLLMWACDNYGDELERRLRELMEALPEARLAKVVAPGLDKIRSASQWGLRGMDMRLATALKTRDVADAVVDLVCRMPKGLYDSSQEELRLLLAGLDVSATDVIVGALGRKKAPMRHLLLEALGKLGSPSAVPTLIEGCGDSVQEASEASLKALAGYAWEALAAPLEAALGAKRKDARLGAAAVLASLPVTEQTQALARSRVGGEKVADVVRLLEQVIASPLASEDTGPPPHEAARQRLDPALVEELGEKLEAYRREGDGGWREGYDEGLEELVKTWPGTALDKALIVIGKTVEQQHNREARLVPMTWRALLEPIADGPEAPWLGVEILARLDYWDLRTAHASVAGALGGDARMVEPMLEAVREYGAQQLQYHSEWLLEAAPDDYLPLVAAELGSTDKHCRQWAEELLGEKVGAKAAPYIWPLLQDRQANVRQRAAAWLEAHPDGASRPALAEALEAEGNKKVRAALETALSACTELEVVLDGATADTDVALDASLSALPEASAALPSFLEGATLPALTWASGGALSEGAQRWFIGAIGFETPDRRNDNLRRARLRLDDASAEAMAAAIDAAYGGRGSNEARAFWIYAQGVLGDDVRMEELGEPLDEMARNNQSAWAFHRVEALRRQGGPVALYWLDVWASAARSKGLMARAQGALEAMTQERGVSLGALLQRAMPPRHGFAANGTRAVQAGRHTLTLRLAPGGVEVEDASGKSLNWRSLGKAVGSNEAKALKPLREAIDRSLALAVSTLERAMTTARAWDWEDWEAAFVGHPVLAICARGVIFEARDGDDALWWTIAEDGRRVDVEGNPASVEGRQIAIPHPLSMTDQERLDWDNRMRHLGLSQPFEQLDRRVFRFDAADPRPFAAALKAQSIQGPSRLMKMSDELGYLRGEVEDGGVFYSFHRGLAEGHKAWLGHEGIPVELRYAPSQIELTGFGVQNAAGDAVDAADMPPLVFTEAMRDLQRFTD